MVSINQLAEMIIDISGKTIQIKNIDGPQGVRGRNSDNGLLNQVLGWAPTTSLIEGIQSTYEWIWEELSRDNRAQNPNPSRPNSFANTRN